ncbi:MAG: cobaltochelatase subunit CobN [Burkholderiaceae bacterium]|nr:cobaltochelatase subunit CobN [Burkholderiaceae bacterium]
MIHRLLLSLCLALFLAPAQAATVLFIATGNVPAGKFRQLADIARPHGIEVQYRQVDKLPAEADAGIFEGADAVFFDTYLQDYVRGKLAGALPGLRVPNAWLYDAQPAWGQMPEPLARRLVAYYANGSRANFEGFFATLAAHLAGRSTEGIADPVVFPKTAVYHPQAPDLVFADPLAYLAWKGIEDPASATRPPIVAIALHQQYIAAMQTDFIDDLIGRIEAAGGVALPFYSPTMDPEAMRAPLQPQGRVIADVLVNMQIMLNPEGRRAEFEALGIPVLQSMPYRDGDVDDWLADPHGVPIASVPFYLAQSEYAGVVDILIAAATRESDDQVVPIAPQAAAVAGKAMKLVALQRKPNADKRLTLFFWNYPAGEKNLSASFMNVPRSLQGTLAALRADGYQVTVPASEEQLLPRLQRLLAPYYRDGQLEALVEENLAELLPVSRYREWLGTLPAAVREELREHWGEPEDSAMVLRRDGEAFFVVPRLMQGNVAILPQPPRGEKWDDKEKALYHSTHAGPSHFFLATYLWAREQQATDAIVHYGTHGIQEWLPGKERGLSVYDAPMLAVGDVPVIYPYIADNIGEAQQTKRRGRAVTISHQTPPFKPAGLYEEITAIHDLLHAWLAQDEGAVKERIRADLLAAPATGRITSDMGWTPERANAEFPAFLEQLHNHLHELAETAQPLGLHSFGQAPEERHRLATVLLMLGRPFWDAAALHAGVPPEDVDEVFTSNYDQLDRSAPYRLLYRHLVENAPADGLEPELRQQIEQARQWYADIGAQAELPALLTTLSGRHLKTSYGGDPIRSPDAYPTGSNLYGFDPSRVPTKQAWEAGKEAAEKLIEEHRKANNGSTPAKITFSLWSVETMRHQGLLEAQALWLLGVEPIWDRGGRVDGVKLVPPETLGRPRVDVVLSATGLYRDHFPNVMKQLAQAAKLAAEAQEADNPVARNAQAIAEQLRGRGLSEEAARRAGQTRIFSSASGSYSTGLDDAALATDTWDGQAEGDEKLAQLYLSRMQYAYGPDEKEWGRAGVRDTGGEAVNLYAMHLSGTEGAVLSRSSNTYGMLTTDDPFQYLGGIGLAVRHLDGKPPSLYISNLRGSGSGRIEGAAQFLAKELATRQFHPGYIEGLMAEGYSGTLQVLDATNNFWGWTAVAREIVRDDQWQEMVDVYVRDKHDLGLKDWFERENPHALAQVIERMLEAARQGYWQADEQTVAELKDRYRDLATRFDVQTDNARFAEFVGFGLDVSSTPAADAAQPPAQQAPEATPSPSGPTETVTGQLMERVESQAVQPEHDWLAAMLVLLLAAIAAVGAARQASSSRIDIAVNSLGACRRQLSTPAAS